MARIPVGWKIWFGDGTILDSRSRTWEGTPSTDVQAVALYWDEQYPHVIQDGWDEHGYPINQRTVMENYLDFLHSADYYWLEFDAQGQIVLKAGQAADVPTGLPAGRTKRGRNMTEAAWRSLYSQAVEQRTW